MIFILTNLLLSRFLYIARGEIEETRSHLAIANRLNYLNREEYNKVDKELLDLLADLNKHKKTLLIKNEEKS